MLGGQGTGRRLATRHSGAVGHAKESGVSKTYGIVAGLQRVGTRGATF